MNIEQNSKKRQKFLFNVDILIESESNGRALEQLIHILNTDEIQDYMIKEGIHLGKTIEIALRESISKQEASDPKGAVKAATKPDGKPEAKKAEIKQEIKPSAKPTTSPVPKNDGAPADQKNQYDEFWDKFQQFKQNNSLIRLTVVKGKGIKLSMPCRILNADESSGNVSVYHVDEKQVYLFTINEIEDYAVSL
jgi:hypothetical protein